MARAPLKAVRKFRNEPIAIGGEKYRSKREAKRHQILLLLERVGQIAELKREVPFVLIPPQRRSDGKAERAVVYIADYVYTEGGITVVEDVKSEPTKTPEYIIKRKLMLSVHGISIKEVS